MKTVSILDWGKEGYWESQIDFAHLTIRMHFDV